MEIFLLKDRKCNYSERSYRFSNFWDFHSASLWKKLAMILLCVGPCMI